jgi:hypothetical protein
MNKHFDIVKPSMKRSQNMSKKRKLVIAGISVCILVCLVAIVWLYSRNVSASFIQNDKYQALFLTNSQVYFGKLQRLNDGAYRLTDVYYIQSNATTNPTEQTSENPATADASKQPTLVKLGSELHGPTDEIIVRDEQVQFWENMKPDGKVTKAIDAYKKRDQ